MGIDGGALSLKMGKNVVLGLLPTATRVGAIAELFVTGEMAERSKALC